MNKQQFRVLYRQFLFRMVDLEVLSSHAQGDMNTLFGQFASLLVVVGLLLCLLALVSGQMGENYAYPMEFLLISTTMLVVGLFAVLSWDSTFPNRRDMLVLAPLPVRGRTIFLAKIAAVATALSLTVVMLHSLAGLFCPLALNRTAPARELLDFRFDPAIAPVKAAELQSVLDRDLAQALHTGVLAPGTGAGVSIGVYQHGVRRVFSYGAAQPDSLFEIGSITKTFTGLILAQMIEQGRVRLDEPVRELLPPGLVSKPAGREISLLDLATHRSGLPRMPGNFHPADPTNPYADYHADQLYEFLRIYPWGVRNPLPTRFAYSNLGFGLLGQALAVRAGMEYPALLQQQVVGPLGLHDTAIALSPDQQRRYIQGYDGSRHPVHHWDLDALAGAGAIRSTAGDMLFYLEAQLHPERWRGAGTLGEALALSHVLRAEAGNGMRIGLSWMYNLADETYEHGGATAGFSSHAYFHPKDDSAVIVLSNNSAGYADLLGIHIRQRLAGQRAQG
jgi:CubicO group peptidase (beta-lactamase class C family)